VKKQKLQHWILAADLVWAAVAMAAAYVFTYGMTWDATAKSRFLTFVPLLLGALVVWAGLFSGMKLDGFRLGWHLPAIVSDLLLATCCLLGFLLAALFLARYYVSRVALAYFGLLLVVGFYMIRRAVHLVLRSSYMRSARRRVLIVGSGPVAREMAVKVERHPEMLCQVVGFLCSADTSLDNRIPGNMSQATTVQTLGVPDLLREHRVDEVIITLSKPGVPEVMNLAARCRLEGIGVSVVPHPYELYLSKPQLLDFGGLPVLQLNEVDTSLANGLAKRALDVSVSCVLLPLSLPLVVVGTLLLGRKEGGPFCSVVRCGRFGKPFRMYRLNSDRSGGVLPPYEALLQRLSITELPQLWNVLCGEMSLVGPRPESPERVKHYSDWQRQRLNIRPGMTGLAQAHGLREQHSSEEKAQFDLQYILHSSPFLDISLLMQTLWILIRRVLHLPASTMPQTEEILEIKNDSLLERILPNAHSTQSSAD
jgi:lipopolysaccharide/colanic/teichoic acid biosynthesis glycosyltransferase